MQVFKPNMDYIAKEAERIEKEAAERGDFPDLKYMKLEKGENHIRVLPPWSARGLVGKLEVQHFRLPPDNKIYHCLIGTWPDKADSCFMCDAIEKILQMFPDINLKRQCPSDQYRLNVIDRNNEEEGPQILRVTAGVYNWITIQMNKKQVGDITDVESGVDLIIEKKESKRKDGGTRIEYKPSFVPRPCPLHEDDVTVHGWLKILPDLDKVIRYPKEERIAEMSDYADQMVAYYVRKHRKSGVGSIDRTDRPGKSTAPESKKDEKPVSLNGLDPRELPKCFGGLDDPEPHDGDSVPDELKGKLGYQPDLNKCMICPQELRCMDATSNRG